MRRVLAGAAAVAVMAVSCQTMPAIQSLHPITTNVCEISENSEVFNGKAVRLHASVLSDLIERTFLISADCPSATVSISMAADAEGGESLKRALVDVMPDGTISATFVGTFEWHADETPARVLNVRAVHDLVIRRDQRAPSGSATPPDPAGTGHRRRRQIEDGGTCNETSSTAGVPGQTIRDGLRLAAITPTETLHSSYDNFGQRFYSHPIGTSRSSTASADGSLIRNE